MSSPSATKPKDTEPVVDTNAALAAVIAGTDGPTAEIRDLPEPDRPRLATSQQRTLSPTAQKSLDDAIAELRMMCLEAEQPQSRGRKFFGRISIEIPWDDGRPAEVLASRIARIRPARGEAL